MLTAISPIDGRYLSKVKELSDYFSEYALIKYRLLIEAQYFMALRHIPLPQLKDFPERATRDLERLVNQFSIDEAQDVKTIEKKTNHDVKSVEYYLKDRFADMGMEKYAEFIHFGLTSQDVNNTAFPLMLKHATANVFLPRLEAVLNKLVQLATQWEQTPMLARTHGQPASPTRMGKELAVFTERLRAQIQQLSQIPFSAKFGGATGNFNAHYAAFPEIDWHAFAEKFISESLGLKRSYPTTQIEHYDNLAAAFQAMKRINTVLIDLCRDVWTYISMDYFRQKAIKGEVGSSAMPHKVNPIDFENAEGNLGLANALFNHLADKLPISRLQRDLTDSTVLRNVGMPVAHSVIAFKAILKGLEKLTLNEERLRADLENNWMVVAEGLQTILRREGYPNPYETLLALTRGKGRVTEGDIRAFIEGLDLRPEVKAELLNIRPETYLGQ